MNKQIELKPCPFCGRTNQRFLTDMDIYHYEKNKGYRAVVCECGLHLYARDNKEAKEKWNRRITEDEWISVDERLPELEGKEKTWGAIKIQDSVRVLCACRQKSGKTLVKEGFYQLWGNGIKWRIPGSIDAVTHWMPLPNPPKMKGGAKE